MPGFDPEGFADAVKQFADALLEANARAGFFKLRLVRGGPWVAAVVQRWGDGMWQAMIDGEWKDPAHEDPAMAGGVSRVILNGRQITEQEYQTISETAHWARINAPSHPAANPLKPVDLNKLPPIF